VLRAEAAALEEELAAQLAEHAGKAGEKPGFEVRVDDSGEG